MIVALLALASVSALADVPANTYTITVTKSNSNVSIDGKTFSAYKLFDVTYVKSVTNGTSTTTTTDYGNDTTPHSYTLSTSSVFYTNTTARAAIEEYFTLKTIEGDNTKVVVEPIMIGEEGSKTSKFTVENAYKLTQALLPYLPTTANASAVAASGKAEIDVSNHGDAGYYLVTGEGFAKNEDGSVNEAKTVTAAVALTTTDPTAKIVAKVDAPTLEKEIDEGTTEGTLDDKDVKEDNHAVGDNVPYILKSKVPNMTGYEKYYFIVNDTMSKGLTFKNDVVIKFVDSKGNVKKTLANGTDYTVTSTGGSGADTEIEIVFKNFIQYKGTEITAENMESLGVNANALIGTYYGSYEDCDIIITYSADVNEYAVIGDLGNPNTAKLTYSNQPDIEDDGDKDNKDKPKNPNVTGETPDSTVKTYVTGLKVLKYTGADKNPLADAKFELTGKNLNKLVEKDTKYFRAITGTEKGTHYLLKDGTYTTTAPVTDDDPETEDIDDQTIDSYVKTWDGETPAPGYVIDNVKSFVLTGTGEDVKVTATTDSEGFLTFTGLAAGDYVLEEVEAPAGYNKLEKKLYITVSVGETEADNNVATHTWTIKYKVGEDGAENTLTSTEPNANLFELDVENNSGVELPSTGGIGTTIFYVGGSILVLAAVILLVTKRRMSAND